MTSRRVLRLVLAGAATVALAGLPSGADGEEKAVGGYTHRVKKDTQYYGRMPEGGKADSGTADGTLKEGSQVAVVKEKQAGKGAVRVRVTGQTNGGKDHYKAIDGAGKDAPFTHVTLQDEQYFRSLQQGSGKNGELQKGSKVKLRKGDEHPANLDFEVEVPADALEPLGGGKDK